MNPLRVHNRLKFTELKPGARIEVIRVKYGNGLSSMAHYLSEHQGGGGTTFGLGEGMTGIVISRVNGLPRDEIFVMIHSKRWGTQFGWCDTLAGFKVIK